LSSKMFEVFSNLENVDDNIRAELDFLLKQNNDFEELIDQTHETYNCEKRQLLKKISSRIGIHSAKSALEYLKNNGDNLITLSDKMKMFLGVNFNMALNVCDVVQQKVKMDLLPKSDYRFADIRNCTIVANEGARDNAQCGWHAIIQCLYHDKYGTLPTTQEILIAIDELKKKMNVKGDMSWPNNWTLAKVINSVGRDFVCIKKNTKGNFMRAYVYTSGSNKRRGHVTLMHTGPENGGHWEWVSPIGQCTKKGKINRKNIDDCDLCCVNFNADGAYDVFSKEDILKFDQRKLDEIFAVTVSRAGGTVEKRGRRRLKRTVGGMTLMFERERSSSRPKTTWVAQNKWNKQV